jgi:protoporphyrinogen oxidase
MFFEYYTENLWGRHPREIDASWGKQRVKGLSIIAILKDVFTKMFHIKNKNKETSLIEEFKYPKYGPGQLWETVASKIESLGGKINTNSKVIGIYIDKNNNSLAKSVTYTSNQGNQTEQLEIKADIVISSMPLKDLVNSFTFRDSDKVPEDILRIANGLPYRDYITVGILVDKLKIKNETAIKTLGNIVPDDWIYVQERKVKMGRLQIYNNWSPYMVKDPFKTVWIGTEYFVQENDQMWNSSDLALKTLAVNELQKIGLIDKDDSKVLDSHVERVKKAYPAYFDTYTEIDKLIAYINNIPNLYCIGRNGQHRYNNMDHSMCTAFEAVKNIEEHIVTKDNIWRVNTEQVYHEEAKSKE